ncbi:MAG: ABC transporter permease [Eubacterium sp.]|nr:ABC transporter permease [Eubacterium sp.]
MKALKKFFEIREASILLIFIAFCVVMMIASPFFLTQSNLTATILGAACNMFLVTAMTVILACGGIDLSVGSTMSLAGVVLAYLSMQKGVPVAAAAIIGILCSVAIGAVNGLICSRTTIAPMICTLGTMSIAKGIAMVLSKGAGISVAQLPASFLNLGKGMIGPIPLLILLGVIVAVIFGFLLRNSSIMRKVYYVGSNAQAADYSGINVAKVKMGVYILSGLLCGISGVLAAARFTVASPIIGDGQEMTAISSAVIGGASLNGGIGSILGSMLGLLLLSFINNALVLLNVNVYWQEFINGVILLLAVLIDYFSHRNEN